MAVFLLTCLRLQFIAALEKHPLGTANNGLQRTDGERAVRQAEAFQFTLDKPTSPIPERDGYYPPIGTMRMFGRHLLCTFCVFAVATVSFTSIADDETKNVGFLTTQNKLSDSVGISSITSIDKVNATDFANHFFLDEARVNGQKFSIDGIRITGKLSIAFLIDGQISDIEISEDEQKLVILQEKSEAYNSSQLPIGF